MRIFNTQCVSTAMLRFTLCKLPVLYFCITVRWTSYRNQLLLNHHHHHHTCFDLLTLVPDLKVKEGKHRLNAAVEIKPSHDGSFLIWMSLKSARLLPTIFIRSVVMPVLYILHRTLYGVTNFSVSNPSGRIVVLGSTQPLTETSTRNSSWG
jgi:hypothetical protein